MTREEAVERIKMILEEATANEDAVSYVTSDDADALDTAIKALEQHCEDAVSRKAMLDYQQYLHGKMPNEENYKLWKFIKDLPPVTPKGVTVTEFADRCRECGREKVLDKIRAEIEDLTYYCCEVHPRTVIDDVLDIIDKYKAESEE